MQERFNSMSLLPHDPGINSYGSTSVSGGSYAHFGNVYQFNNGEQKRSVVDLLKKSLSFPRMGARLRNVASPSPATCQWLFRNDSFVAWTDDQQLPQHHGFFYIKGKPGSGKSTIMKRTLVWAKRTWPARTQIAYFFNARALDPLERTTLGLYRSLVYQVLSANVELEELFAEMFQDKIGGTEKLADAWEEGELKNFLLESVALCQPLTIFIDALDEGYDEEIDDLIIFLESLAHQADACSKPLRICFSSRHYPAIFVRKGLSIAVEDQNGQREDLKTYITNIFPVLQSDEMRALQISILSSSQGIFLWVVVVVPMLMKIYAQGKPTTVMMQKLQEVPADIYDLFSSILDRHQSDMEECFSLLRWIVYTQETLTLEELYSAVRESHIAARSDDSSVASVADMKRYITHCSRGLAEVVAHTKQEQQSENVELAEDSGDREEFASIAAAWSSASKSEGSTVQLIHVSVRDFLVHKDEPSRQSLSETNRLLLDQAFEQQFCHAKMAEVCLNQLLRICHSHSQEHHSGPPLWLSGYASVYWWQHIQNAGDLCTDACIRLACNLLTDEDNIRKWARLIKTRTGLEYEHKTAPYRGPDTKYDEIQLFIHKEDIGHGLYFCAKRNLLRILRSLLRTDTNIDTKGGKFGSPLQVAAYFGHEEAVQCLIDAGADLEIRSAIFGTALDVAVFRREEKITRMLLQAGARVNEEGGFNGSALEVATREGDLAMVQLLQERREHQSWTVVSHQDSAGT